MTLHSVETAAGQKPHPRSHVVRSRWAAIGAAIAVSLGGGSAIFVATASSEPSVFVSVTPVRILDSRVDLGLPGALVSASGQDLQVTGNVATTFGSQVVVPPGATAVVMNVTAVLPTANGWISVRPAALGTRPATSSLNVAAGSIVPNSVTVALPTSGKVELTFDAFGQPGPATDVLGDVVGYFVAGGAGSAGPAGATGPAGSAGPAGATGPAGPQGLSAWDVIPSGVTVRGHIAWDIEATGAEGDFNISVAFPARAPVALTNASVNFSTSSGAPPLVDGGDPTCNGTTAAPTAPAGKVCIYRISSLNVTGLQGVRLGNFNGGVATLSDHGFQVRMFGSATAGLNDDQYLYATWAYTAP